MTTKNLTANLIGHRVTTTDRNGWTHTGIYLGCMPCDLAPQELYHYWQGGDINGHPQPTTITGHRSHGCMDSTVFVDIVDHGWADVPVALTVRQIAAESFLADRYAGDLAYMLAEADQADIDLVTVHHPDADPAILDEWLAENPDLTMPPQSAEESDRIRETGGEFKLAGDIEEGDRFVRPGLQWIVTAESDAMVDGPFVTIRVSGVAKTLTVSKKMQFEMVA